MKYILLIILQSIIMNELDAQMLPTREVLQRTFYMQYETSTATCFLTEEKGKNFFITAKHVFPKKNDDDTVEFRIHRDTSWETIHGRIYMPDKPGIDLVVIELLYSNKLFPAIKMKFVPFSGGQQGFFLGFPMNLENTAGYSINDNFPLPLIKGLIFSGIIKLNGMDNFIFDGQNNPGFSGGPIIFKNASDSSDKLSHVIAVVSGYLPQQNKAVVGTGTFNYAENSGIMVGVPITHALDIIKRKYPD